MTTYSAVLLCRIVLAPLTVGTVHFANVFSCLTKRSIHVQYATRFVLFDMEHKVYLDPGSLDQGVFIISLLGKNPVTNSLQE